MLPPVSRGCWCARLGMLRCEQHKTRALSLSGPRDGIFRRKRRARSLPRADKATRYLVSRICLEFQLLVILCLRIAWLFAFPENFWNPSLWRSGGHSPVGSRLRGSGTGPGSSGQMPRPPVPRGEQADKADKAPGDGAQHTPWGDKALVE